ncbi:MAG: UDP-glucose 6-dehydrogenase [Candidatus Saccharibacteria bacterium]|nr:UDP-glucose 6-dehydrogenase [Candidatus Saccharibacteria bacterium]
MNITVVGTGYVGLVGGVCMASMGHQVTCVDIDEAKVETLRQGKTPIYEPELQALLEQTLASGSIVFTTSLEEAVVAAEVVFLALPTPPGENGEADLSYVLQVAEQLSPLVDHYMVIVDKSTVPVGTAQRVREKIAAQATAEFAVVSNPEFLREGHAVHDFMHPDRVVLGTDSEKARQVLRELYAPIATADSIIEMDEASAELAKYAANSFLATKVSFMNEIANLCDLLGANVDAVRLGIGSDERIGRHFLQAGIGYGGSCFPKDVQALVQAASNVGYDFKILQSLIAVNTEQKLRLVEQATDHFGALEGKHIAVWGLAFKPDTDDIREAPALTTIRHLLDAGATVTAYDPEAISNTQQYFSDQPGLTFATDPYDALSAADALFIITEWKVFKQADLVQLKQRLAQPVIFDGRNIFDPRHMWEQGFTYYSIGRPLKGPVAA